jgi:hypothetical protein
LESAVDAAPHFIAMNTKHRTPNFGSARNSSRVAALSRDGLSRITKITKRTHFGNLDLAANTGDFAKSVSNRQGKRTHFEAMEKPEKMRKKIRRPGVSIPRICCFLDMPLNRLHDIPVNCLAAVSIQNPSQRRSICDAIPSLVSMY